MSALLAPSDIELGHQAVVHLEAEVTHLIGKFGQAANQALFAVKELIVDTEMTIEEIAEHFGIHHFGIHLMAKSLSECKIVLTSDSHLEIHRENQQHPTRFKVERKQLLAA